MINSHLVKMQLLKLQTCNMTYELFTLKYFIVGWMSYSCTYSEIYSKLVVGNTLLVSEITFKQYLFKGGRIKYLILRYIFVVKVKDPLSNHYIYERLITTNCDWSLGYKSCFTIFTGNIHVTTSEP